MEVFLLNIVHSVRSVLSVRVCLFLQTNLSEGIILVAETKGESSVDSAAGTSATISVFIAGGKYLHLTINTPDIYPHQVLTFDQAEIVDGE